MNKEKCKVCNKMMGNSGSLSGIHQKCEEKTTINNFEEWVRQTVSITERENFLGFTTKSFIELTHTIREKVIRECINTAPGFFRLEKGLKGSMLEAHIEGYNQAIKHYQESLLNLLTKE